MIPKDIEASTHHLQNVSITVNGGEITNPLSHSVISDEEFQKALESSIKNSGVFSSVVKRGNSDFLLDVVIANLGQPFAGIDMTVTFTTHWKLSQLNKPNVIWEDFVSTKYTATPGDSLIGIKRLRMANEGAARENIKEGIRRLSLVKL